MKKVILFASVAALALSFASCKKDYTCTCTATAGGISSSASTTLNATKKDAKDACESGSSTQGSVTVKCEIE